jgi:hypothetical protein
VLVVIRGSSSVDLLSEIDPDPQSPRGYLVASRNAVYRTTGAMFLFTFVCEAPSGTILSMAYDPLTDQLFVGTTEDVYSVKP